MPRFEPVVKWQVLAINQAMALYKLRCNHELLRFVFHVRNDSIWKEFKKRFGKRNVTSKTQLTYADMAYMYEKYFVALEKACEEFGKPTVSH